MAPLGTVWLRLTVPFYVWGPCFALQGNAPAFEVNFAHG